MSEDSLAPLVLVVGPSGAGKDSLIDCARRAMAGDPSIHFARRVITRASSASEEHDSLDLAEFEGAERAGKFILSWRAHGLAYGIPVEVQNHRRAGIAVVANASRTVIDEARRRLTPVHVILVTAPTAILMERLRQRGRENADGSAARLASAEIALPQGLDVTTVLNGGTLADGEAAFAAALRQIRSYAI